VASGDVPMSPWLLVVEELGYVNASNHRHTLWDQPHPRAEHSTAFRRLHESRSTACTRTTDRPAFLFGTQRGGPPIPIRALQRAWSTVLIRAIAHHEYGLAGCVERSPHDGSIHLGRIILRRPDHAECRTPPPTFVSTYATPHPGPLPGRHLARATTAGRKATADL
jgi:hypothetical protein